MDMSSSRQCKVLSKHEYIEKENARPTCMERESIIRKSKNPMENDKLGPGDHIIWERPCGACHHAIVKEQKEPSHILKVVHWAPSGCRKIMIKDETINLHKQIGCLYRIKYEEEVASRNPPDLVIKRANALHGLKDYNLFTRNCENFARFCKTGISFNKQFPRLKRKFNQTFTTAAITSAFAVSNVPLSWLYFI